MKDARAALMADLRGARERNDGDAGPNDATQFAPAVRTTGTGVAGPMPL